MPAVETETFILVERPGNAYRDSLRRYSIEIDGKVAGVIKPGKTLRISVEPGKRTVRAKIDWTGSEELTLTLHPHQTVRLTVQPSGGSFRWWQMFRKDGYLQLSEDR